MEYKTRPIESYYMTYAKRIRDLSKCAKQKVGCVIVGTDGMIIGLGNNDTEFEQNECPRDVHGMKSGEGYELCHSVCGQSFHAEEAAIMYMGSLRAKGWNWPSNKGASAYLYGHYYCCKNCELELEKAGVTTTYILEDADINTDWSKL